MNSNTVYEAFITTCKEFGNHPFLHIPENATPYDSGSIDVTYQETLDKVDALASAYKNAG